MTTQDNLKAAMGDVAFIEGLINKCDPASGISISLRRGVPQDNDAVEDDHERRPWRSFSFSGMPDHACCGDHDVVINLLKTLLQERKNLVVFWRNALVRDMDEARVVLEEGEKMLARTNEIPKAKR